MFTFYAIFLIEDHLGCFECDLKGNWESAPFKQGIFEPIQEEETLKWLLEDLEDRLKRASPLDQVELHILYSDESQIYLGPVCEAVEAAGCSHWQLLRWEPLIERLQEMGLPTPEGQLPQEKWLLQFLLPRLEDGIETLLRVKRLEQTKMKDQLISAQKSHANLNDLLL